MSLASEISNAMADGRIDRLPRLTRNASPEFARDLLEAYYRLRDKLADMRQDEGSRLSLRDRLDYALVAERIEDAIAHTNEWLSRIARRGGRGIPARGCRGGTPAVMAHGCADLVPAVGPAPVVSQVPEKPLPADPLLLALPMQELPVGGPSLPVNIICDTEAKS